MKHYIPTGNEYVSLPKINEETGGIEDVTFLTMTHKGMFEITGGAGIPLILPFISVNGEELPLTNMRWTRDHFWIPSMIATAGAYTLCMSVMAPIGERVFAIRLHVSGGNGEEFRWGVRGRWANSLHCINEDKKLDGHAECFRSGWNGSILFEFYSGCPLFAFAPMCDHSTEPSFTKGDGFIDYSISRTDTVTEGNDAEITFFFGVGCEEVSAGASACNVLRHTWECEYEKTCEWLSARTTVLPSEKLTEIYNTNLFFCIFFSTGITIDTEELVCITSRSTRYYVSAAYWDRDVLLWAYPAILDADIELSGEILRYVFGRQRRNIGVHSHYIDGTLLEPGFELDELAAPVISLNKYILAGGDRSILTEANTLTAIAQIVKTLASVRNRDIPLYETFLQPTDDERTFPYLTYDNVLVWYAMKALAELYPDKYSYLSDEADKVRAAIYKYCVSCEYNGKDMFAWSTNLKGDCSIYDEPPGSLQLLPFFGFCGRDDEIWKNTIEFIRSPSYSYSFHGFPFSEIGCAHANHPWILSFGNSMLSGYAASSLSMVERLKMDNGIACESVNENTGECSSGAAFATCAGFLCHAIKVACDETK